MDNQTKIIIAAEELLQKAISLQSALAMNMLDNHKLCAKTDPKRELRVLNNLAVLTKAINSMPTYTRMT